jgi:hypothetical protein
MSVTLHVPVAPGTEARLRERAALVGQDVATYAARVLERSAEQPLSLEEISGPIAEEFHRSGMSEEQLSDLLEKAEHEARRRRRVP